MKEIQYKNNYWIPRFIFIHHTGVSLKKNPDQFTATNNYHKSIGFNQSELGFFVGYNFEIASDGTVKQARLIGEETCAQLAYNSSSISICLDGNFDEENPTEAQITALKVIIRLLMNKYSSIRPEIRPHRYVATVLVQGKPYVKNTSKWVTIDGSQPYKSCPGANMTDSFIADLPTEDAIASLASARNSIRDVIKKLQDLI